MRHSRVRTSVIAVAATAALALTACGGKQDRTSDTAASGGSGADSCTATAGQITIATGNSTGVYYALGGGLAQLISTNTDLKATAAETGASVQNIQQLVDKKYDIAFSLADTAADAVTGKGAFEGKKADVKALARIYSNYTQVVVSKKSGITKVEDFKGKRISTGSPKSGTEVIANRLIEAAGLDPAKDVKAQRLDLTKTVDGMKDGSIDGLVWSGGLPTGGITDLMTSMGDQVQFVDITPLLPKLQEANPVYAEDVIPSATYKTATDAKTVVVPNLLLVRSDMSEGNACALTKLIFDKKSDLEKVHPAAKDLDPATAKEADPVELHPGSKKALDGLG
ncbi:TAXI family TRAP transporter solute-binding subunit [Knoellia locipacati]|uniref:C4-dicarboxylate ABC transporter substrate-binding protein n=1 Tax=Knoellia locipacati TaxID=882824 RepID=A0A512T4S8_9MICO|nr:TAXI family TRAP transporter solute-binding subunit [Knoellia locipacati]GEQ15225.1 C4-dicarboxylate ABC transporter substrate-binding protein [Knoellia locipacati]